MQIRALSKLFTKPQKRIMSVSLAASLVLHALLFVSLQKAFPLSWMTENLKTYQVELLRPPMVDFEDGAGTGAEVGPAQDDRKTPGEEDQETISLDTDDQRYVSYARAIKERIAKEWKYPPQARATLLEGKLKVLFSLTKTGELSRIQVTETSGSPVLDQEAARAVRAASPYPPFPPHVTAGRLNIDARFEYRLTQAK